MLELFEALVPLLDGTDLLLQNSRPVDPGPGGIFGLAGGAMGAFLSTLIVGGILLAVLPDYTEGKVRNVFGDPVASFVYGFLALILLALVVVVLVITVVGIIVAIPLVVLAWLVWAVGATLAFLAIGDRLVGHRDGWLKALLVGALINGALALTGIGGLVSFVLGAIGFGTVLREYV